MQGSEPPREPATPQSAWRSQEEKEEPRMQVTMTTDELCAWAHSYEKRNVWAHWMAAVVCVFFAGGLGYSVFSVTQPWIRLGQAWTLGAICFLAGTMLQRGQRRIGANEPCVTFLERSLQGKRDGALEIRRALLLFIPGIVATWWGRGPAVRARALGIDPSGWLFQFASGPGPFLAVGLTLAIVWFAFGKTAEKAQQEIEEIRRSQRAR